MKYTYLEDLINENKKDNKLKSDMIYAIYSRARCDISSKIRANDNNDNKNGIFFQSDDILYNCIHPKLYKLMCKVDQATDIAVAIEVKEIERFNRHKGVEIDALKHLESPIIWDKSHNPIFLFDLNDKDLCDLFNTKIDEICKLCEEIKGDNHHESNRY